MAICTHGLDLSFLKTPESKRFLTAAKAEADKARAKRHADCAANKRSDLPSPYFMSDISPFVSVVGKEPEVISSRKHLRDHERAYNCYQVGDDIRASDIIAENEAVREEWKEAAANTEHGWIDPDL